MDVGLAAAAVLYCTDQVGSSSALTMGWSWEAALPLWVGVLKVLGYFSFAGICFLPMINTFNRPWEMNSVGAGTRGEPFVVSLVSYICPFLLTCVNNGWNIHKLKMDESAWFNGIGAIVYVIYIAIFLYCADGDNMRTTVWKWVRPAAAYIFLTAGVLWIESSMAVWLCTLAGLASASISLLLAILVVERHLENLPDRLSSSCSLVYYVIWVLRSVSPKLDFHAMVPNLVGVVCSAFFLALLKIWKSKAQIAAEDEQEPLLPKLPEPPTPPPHLREPDPPLPQQPLQEPPAAINEQQAANPAGNLHPGANLAEHNDPQDDAVAEHNDPQDDAQEEHNAALPQPQQPRQEPPAAINEQQAANPAENLHPGANLAEHNAPQDDALAEHIHQQDDAPAEPMNPLPERRRVASAPSTPEGKPRMVIHMRRRKFASR